VIPMTILTSTSHATRVKKLENRLQRRGLRVIVGGLNPTGDGKRGRQMAGVSESFEPGEQSMLALKTLESQLEGEHWFLEQTRATIRQTIGLENPEAPLPVKDFKNLLTKTGHDNLIHIAQFYFFLNALNCVAPNQIEAFIDAHNKKVDAELGKDGALMRADALKKTIFSTNDITKIRMTFLYYKEPVFAVTELGKFLSDLMSPATTTNLIKELVVGGVFEHLAGPQFKGNEKLERDLDGGPLSTDPRRKLIRPTARFLNDYKTSLLMARQKIMSTG
jgi:hypothetical protein